MSILLVVYLSGVVLMALVFIVVGCFLHKRENITTAYIITSVILAGLSWLGAIIVFISGIVTYRDDMVISREEDGKQVEER